jgi:malate dehydrogenase (oxaloacetate-decarboxylating)(NADP+)
MSTVYAKAKKKLAKIVFVEGHHPKIQHAAQILHDDGICEPILLALETPERVRAQIAEQHLEGLDKVSIVNPIHSELNPHYVQRLWELRQRKGMTLEEARMRTRQRAFFAAMMVKEGQADGLVAGLTTNHADAISAPLQVIGTRPGHRAAGVYVVVSKNEFRFFADCSVNIDPTAEELADIAIETAGLARYFDIKPRVALLSYSTFGSAHGKSPEKMRTAAALVRQRQPDLEVDGELQVDIAMSGDTRVPEFPFTNLKEDANVLIFPNLDAANIGYQLLARIGGAEVIGPVLLGMQKPVSILQMGSSVESIVNLAAFTALRAQGEQFTF